MSGKKRWRSKSMEYQIEAALAQLEREINLHDDPVMALADCVGVVLMVWDSLDPAGRRELLARVDRTVRELYSSAGAELMSASAEFGS